MSHHKFKYFDEFMHAGIVVLDYTIHGIRYGNFISDLCVNLIGLFAMDWFYFIKSHMLMLSAIFCSCFT